MASLEEFIAQEIERVLDHQERGQISTPLAERGMAIGGPDKPEIVLTVEDVARIAARAVKLHRVQPTGDGPPMERNPNSTPETRAWAKRVLAESRERHALDPGAGRRWLEDVMARAEERSQAEQNGESEPDA